MTAPDPIRRAGLLGDIHAEDELLARALDWFDRQRVDAILCTGDIADGGGDLGRACALLQQADVRTVRGNHDRWLLEGRLRGVPDAHHRSDQDAETLAFLGALPATIEIETARGHLMLCHGVARNDMRKVWPGTERLEAKRSPELDALLHEGHYRFLIQGHSHYRVLVDFPQFLVINAGTLVPRHRPGVSIVDFEAGSIACYEFQDGHLGPLAIEEPLDPGPSRRVWANTEAFDGNWTAVALYGEPLP